VDEIALVGSRCGPFRPALTRLASGRIDVGPLVAGTFPLSAFACAFELARRGLKVVFTMEEGS